MSARIKIVGDTNFIKNLSLHGALNGEIGAALYQVATTVLADSQDNYVPVDTGQLRQSATALAPEYGTGNSDEVSVVFGYDTQYAEIVHDRPPTIGQGKVKYLEIPFAQIMEKAEDLIETHVMQAVNIIRKTKRPTPTTTWLKYREEKYTPESTVSDDST